MPTTFFLLGPSAMPRKIRRFHGALCIGGQRTSVVDRPDGRVAPADIAMPVRKKTDGTQAPTQLDRQHRIDGSVNLAGL